MPVTTAADAKEYRLRKKNMTVVEYDSMRARQDNKCVICRRTFTKAYSDFVDGRVRGLLCFLCTKVVRVLSKLNAQGVPLYPAVDYIRTRKS